MCNKYIILNEENWESRIQKPEERIRKPLHKGRREFAKMRNY